MGNSVSNKELEEALEEKELIENDISMAEEETAIDEIEEEIENDSPTNEKKKKDSKEEIGATKSEISNIADSMEQSSKTIDDAVGKLEEHSNMISDEQQNINDIVKAALETRGGQLILKDELSLIRDLENKVKGGSVDGLTMGNVKTEYLRTIANNARAQFGHDGVELIKSDTPFTKELAQELIASGQATKAEYNKKHSYFASISMSLKEKSRQAKAFAEKVGKTIGVKVAMTYAQDLKQFDRLGKNVAKDAKFISQKLDDIKRTLNICKEKSGQALDKTCEAVQKSFSEVKKTTERQIANARMYNNHIYMEFSYKRKLAEKNLNRAKNVSKLVSYCCEKKADIKVAVVKKTRQIAKMPPMTKAEERNVRAESWEKNAALIKKTEITLTKAAKTYNNISLSAYAKDYHIINKMKNISAAEKDAKLQAIKGKINALNYGNDRKTDYINKLSVASNKDIAMLYKKDMDGVNYRELMKNEDVYVKAFCVNLDEVPKDKINALMKDDTVRRLTGEKENPAFKGNNLDRIEKKIAFTNTMDVINTGDGKIRFVAYDIESAKEFDKIMKDNEIKRFVQRNSIARNEDVKEKNNNRDDKSKSKSSKPKDRSDEFNR